MKLEHPLYIELKALVVKYCLASKVRKEYIVVHPRH